MAYGAIVFLMMALLSCMEQHAREHKDHELEQKINKLEQRLENQNEYRI
jgi:hypothetical protein